MKIIHLSDPHICTDKIHGIDPVDRFKKALEHIIQHHRDADLFSITGDIADLGDKDSYQLFINIINDFDLPSNLEPQLIIGNHDNREEFKKNFQSMNMDENGFVQYFKDIKNKRFIFLDTVCFRKSNNAKDNAKGFYCKNRQSWLKKILSETSNDKDIYIFMHHNPIALVKDESDGLGLQQKDEFKEIMLNYNKKIKHIFFGHQHITISGSFCDITISSPRSTWSPLIPNFSNKYRLGTAHNDPNYNVAIIRSDATIIHTEDFLKSEVIWFNQK